MSRRLAGASLLTALACGWTAAPALAAGEPAKGAPIGDVIWGTAVAMALTAAVLWVAMAHRAGRITWLGRLAGFSERVSGLPGWAALPSAITGGSLLVAVFGFYWDVAKHIDTGRDPGPFGTAAHYPILVGLFGIALGGFTAIVLGTGRDVRTSVRLSADWRAPLGGVLIFLCGAFALSGFPLDDVWHTLFGQDVTLWGPTHVLMIGGASLATLGVWVLLVEGRRHRPEAASSRWEALAMRARTISIAGGFMLGLSTLQGEFDYGVPQFQLVYHPILLMLAAGVGLVAARVRLGRGGALGAALFFVVVRAILTLLIGPVLGRSTLHFPLYLAEAGLVEVAAFRVRRPVALGLVSGALIGTIGLAAEWGWSHVWMPLAWPASLLPEAAVLGFAAAIAGGTLGGYIGRALTTDSRGDMGAAPGWLLGLAGALAVACIAFPLPMTAGSAASANVRLTDVTPAPHRTVAATVRLSPPGVAKNAQWLTVTAWQGGGLVVDHLRKIGTGVYRTTEPIPVFGKWKAMLRMENGRGVRAVPLYLPEDKAIPAKEVPANSSFTRSFVRDKRVLQREAVGGSGWLSTPAYLLLLAIAAGWIAALTWGLRRLQGLGGGGDETERRATRTPRRRAVAA